MTDAMTADAERDVHEIIRVLRAINRAWTSGCAEEMRQYLDERVVMVQPGFEERIIGRQACIESYEEFARQARIERYVESQTSVDVTDDTAVATYHFIIDYELGGIRHHDVGHDLFVFARGAGRWRAIWRTLIPQPAEGYELAPAT